MLQENVRTPHIYTTTSARYSRRTANCWRLSGPPEAVQGKQTHWTMARLFHPARYKAAGSQIIISGTGMPEGRCLPSWNKSDSDWSVVLIKKRGQTHRLTPKRVLIINTEAPKAKIWTRVTMINTLISSWQMFLWLHADWMNLQHRHLWLRNPLDVHMKSFLTVWQRVDPVFVQPHGDGVHLCLPRSLLQLASLLSQSALHHGRLGQRAIWILWTEETRQSVTEVNVYFQSLKTCLNKS